MKPARSLRQVITALYGVQGVGYLLPLILVPVLARRLGPEAWGRLALAQGLIVYLAGVVEFGFQFSATREASRHRHDQDALTRLLSGVTGAKALLALTAALGLGLVRSHAAFAHLGRDLLWASWTAAVAQGFSLFWLYQGLEMVRRAAILEMVGRVLATVLCLFWVHQPSEIWRVPALQACGSILAIGVEVHGLRHLVPWRRPSWSTLMTTVRDGCTLFVFRTALNLYAACNVFVLNCFVPLRLVAFYAGPERLAKAVVSCLQPISQALFPRSSYLAAKDPQAAARLGGQALGAMGAIGLLAGAVLHWAARAIIRLAFGPGFEPAAAVLRWIAALAPLVAVNMALALQFMVPQGRDRALTRILLLAGAFNFMAAWWAAPRYGAAGMAVCVVVTEALILVASLWELQTPLPAMTRQRRLAVAASAEVR